MISIILVEPKFAGNVGAVARVMKNFGFSELIIVKPNCEVMGREALNRASHGFDVLESAKIVDSVPKLDCLIGTTGKLGTDFNLKRSPLSPKELAEKLANAKDSISIGIVFGREDTGLNNEELGMCDFTVTINTSKKYPILNLSHSVAVILYDLHELLGENEKKINNITPIGKKEKEKLLNLIFSTLDSMKFSAPHKKDTQKKLWKQIIGKAMLTKREFMALMGYFRKV